MTAAEPVRVAMWSGPRNISTAMMRAFGNRSDTAVRDEPFYAHYLQATGLAHPMAAQIIAAYDTDWRKVAADLTGPAPGDARIFYQKHMTHHMLPHIDLDWLHRLRHGFLIRAPARVLASYAERRADVTLQDLGMPQQVRLFDEVRRRTGRVPPVLDADDVLADPRAMLAAFCASVGIDFQDAMLSWPAGRRDSDGLWAAHWYAAVERSTGFMAAPACHRPMPPELAAIAEAAQPLYQQLFQHRIMI